MRRRTALFALATTALQPRSATALAARRLEFPADFGAHPEQSIEWWYLTGWLSERRGTANDSSSTDAREQFGFQITFFRSKTGVATDHPSRFAASQLLFAHAALTDLGARRARHDQRIARVGTGLAELDIRATKLRLRNWTLARDGAVESGRYVTGVHCPDAGFGFELVCETTQPVLVQGEHGWSRKGPQASQASLYYSEPQLRVSGTLRRGAGAIGVLGRAWLDHEWSDALLDPQAVGWDWIGMNLFDGSALTAFRLRRADASALYAGGSVRRGAAAARNFASGAVHFTPQRWWTSPHSAARYPVQWTIETPGGTFTVRALLDDQELDSRPSTGAIYWEGLSELLDGSDRRVGLGYLEMTGYAAALRL